MSILLDALRKSEEQRRLGSAPSIHDGSGAQPPGSAPGQQWIPMALVALAAVALAWIGWEQYRQPPAEVRSEMAANAEPGAGQADPGPARPGTPVETFAADVTPPQAHTGPPDANQRERVTRSFRAYEGRQEADEAAGKQAPPREEQAAAASPDTVREPPPARRQAAARSQPRSRSEPEQPADSEPITFWELPQGVRDSLPELRITVLVYAETPEDRFLLLSGQRLVEKDELEGGVVLDEIRRDGAVFLYRNYRFLVKG